MNLKVLKQSEKNFLKQYPGGFSHPEMIAMGKKHKMDQLISMTRESFSKDKFDDPNSVLLEMSKLVSRSSMISLFEKPKFKDMVTALRPKEKEKMSESLYQLLHGKEELGFSGLVSELRQRKMGKWTIATLVQSYFKPQKDVMVKPTTTKLIIEKLDLGLQYHPTPTWDFYKSYRKQINALKDNVHKNLFPSNAAFSGFLMMSLGCHELN